MDSYNADIQQALGVTLSKLAVKHATEILDQIIPELDRTDDIIEILALYRAAILTACAVPALIAHAFYDAMRRSAKDSLSPSQIHQLRTIVCQFAVESVGELFQTLAQHGSSLQTHH
jgi:hypothetical protein